MLSEKGKELIGHYETMADGYDRDDGTQSAFNDFELWFYRGSLRPVFTELQVKTVLDYGCGGSDWTEAIEYFDLETVHRYEPARDIDERQKADCVTCFDVLEHVFIADVSTVLRDIFKNAEKLVVLNIACYKSQALLPNGENAHITLRHPVWWKGAIDIVSMDYPDVNVLLLCSTGWRDSEMLPIWRSNMRDASETFVCNI